MKTTSGERKQRRKIYERAPLASERPLIRRDNEMLVTTATYRCLTSEQFTKTFFPPSEEHKLMKWGINKQQVQDLIEQKSAPYLDQMTELLKWLVQTRKVKLATRLTSSAHKKLQK